MNNYLYGKFTQQLVYIGQWIQQRKKFLFIAPDYVVVGLSMEEYTKHFPSKDKVEKKQIIIIDEADEIPERFTEEECKHGCKKDNCGNCGLLGK